MPAPFDDFTPSAPIAAVLVGDDVDVLHPSTAGDFSFRPVRVEFEPMEQRRFPVIDASEDEQPHAAIRLLPPAMDEDCGNQSIAGFDADDFQVKLFGFGADSKFIAHSQVGEVVVTHSNETEHPYLPKRVCVPAAASVRVEIDLLNKSRVVDRGGSFGALEVVTVEI